MPGDRPGIVRRAVLAMSLSRRLLPRVEHLEQRAAALEAHASTVGPLFHAIEEIRSELAQLRRAFEERLDAEAEATELAGRLLQATEARLEALEQGGGDLAR